MTEMHGGGRYVLPTVNDVGLELWRSLETHSLGQRYAAAVNVLQNTEAPWTRLFAVPEEARAVLLCADTPTRIHRIGGLVLQDVAMNLLLDRDFRHGKDVRIAEIATQVGKKTLQVTAYLQEESIEMLQWEQECIARRLQEMTKSRQSYNWGPTPDSLVLAHVPKRSPDTATIVRSAFDGLRRVRLGRLQMNDAD